MIKRIPIFLLILSIKINAQVDSLTNYFDDLQNYIEKTSLLDEEDENNFYETIEDLLRNPININKASVQELLTIPILDFSTADKIIKYRNRNNNFYSLNELFLIDNLSHELITLIKPLLILNDKEPELITKEPFLNFINSRNRIVQDIQSRKGFNNGNYLGTKPKIYNRIQISAKDYFLNLTQEKDAGENSFTDFYSGSFSISNLSYIKKFIIGDFNLAFGQGLALAKPFGARKGSYSTISIIKNQKYVSEYTSTNETNFFRGSSAIINLFDFDINLFYSKNKISTNLNDEAKITSIKVDGIYRTANDLTKKQNVLLKSFGGSINFTNEIFHIGVLYTNFDFDKKFSSDYSEYIADENSFDFISSDYSLTLNDVFLTGEFSYNGLSIASINNLFINISRKFRFITSFRNYPSNYFNFFANGFGERSNTQNEVGFYSGFQLRSGIGTFDLYFDQFKFPNKDELSFPFSGNELSIFYHNKFTKSLGINLRYFIENKDDEIESDGSLKIAKAKKQRVRADFSYSTIKSIKLKTRFEFNNFSIDELNKSEKGFLVYQDIKFYTLNDLRLYGRFIIFQTDSYNSRIYEFENDLLGTFASRALYGNGYRWYIMAKYQIINQLELSIKYSNTLRTDVEEIGSGDQTIKGNLENRVSMQIDLKF